MIVGERATLIRVAYQPIPPAGITAPPIRSEGSMTVNYVNAGSRTRAASTSIRLIVTRRRPRSTPTSPERVTSGSIDTRRGAG